MWTSADRVADLLDGVSQPVVVVDHDATILRANVACAEALGCESPDQLVGLRRHPTMHPRRADGRAYPEAECPLQQAGASGERAWGDGEWFVRRDGSRFPVSWSSAPIDLPGGPGAVVGFTPVTDGHAARGRPLVDHERSMRERIARELHDGAQQRLVLALVTLQLARDEMSASPSRAGELTHEATGHVQVALDDLRELATSVHPAILTPRGLQPAVEGLALRAPLPVRVVSRLEARLPEAVEAQAYYLVADGVAAAAEEPGATHVVVTLGRSASVVTVEISVDVPQIAHGDDPRGPYRDLALRAEALGGSFTRAARAGGTVLRVELPIGGSSAGFLAPDD